MKKIISLILVCAFVIGMALTLVSCGAPKKDPKKAKEALEDNGYSVTLLENESLSVINTKGLEAYIFAYDEGDEQIYIYYFEDKASAKEAYESFEEEYKSLKAAYESVGKDYNFKLGKSGKMIWLGTKEAIKAAK